MGYVTKKELEFLKGELFRAKLFDSEKEFEANCLNFIIQPKTQAQKFVSSLKRKEIRANAEKLIGELFYKEVG